MAEKALSATTLYKLTLNFCSAPFPMSGWVGSCLSVLLEAGICPPDEVAVARCRKPFDEWAACVSLVRVSRGATVFLAVPV